MKVLLAGVAVAAASGMLLGRAMQPDLVGDSRPMGPQTFSVASGERSTRPLDPSVSLASYSGPPPSYVVGTDAAKATKAADQALTSGSRDEADEAMPTAAQFAHAAYDEPAAGPVAYPSVAGGSVYDADDVAPARDLDAAADAPTG